MNLLLRKARIAVTPRSWRLKRVLSNGAVGPFNPGPSWQIKDIGDFNGGSKSDILGQNSDGTPAIWLMNGTAVTAFGGALPDPGAAWHLV